MEKGIFYIVEFIIVFIIMLIIYVGTLIYNKRKVKKGKMPSEMVDLKLFVLLNKLDKEKIKEKKLIAVLAFLNSLNTALVLLLTELSNNGFLKILIALVSAPILLLSSYKCFGIWFKK